MTSLTHTLVRFVAAQDDHAVSPEEALELYRQVAIQMVIVFGKKKPGQANGRLHCIPCSHHASYVQCQ